MEKKRIFLSSPKMSNEGYELAYIHEAFDKNWIAPLGENVDCFENEIGAYTGAPHCCALSSGTAAIHLALKCAGVKPGDYVLVQSLTFAASANPVIYEQGIPVFIDSAPGSFNLDPDLLKEAIEIFRPKALITVNLYGYPSQLDRIKIICEANGVILIEDAAESLGTTYKNQYTGTFGDYGVYSFNGNKIITTSGGGMLVAHNPESIKKAKFWATQARDKARHYQHSEIGYNYRLSNICAGIGRGQLRVLDERIEQKRHIFHRYYNELKDLDGVSFVLEKSDEHVNYWLSTMIIEHPHITPLMVLEALERENIEGRPIWKPMHMQPVFQSYPKIGGKVSEYMFEHGLCLPSDVNMTDDDQSFVIQRIRQLWKA